MNGKAADKKGKVIVISGPSGTGKSTICRRLCEELPAEFSVSVTTRPPRPNETADRDYHYVTPEEFARLKDGGELLEWAEVYGKHYGTPASAVNKAVADGRIIILEIDVRGCIQVHERIPEAIAFFILPPTAEEQKNRLEGRKTDAPESVAERLAKADGEIRYANESACYDEFVVNDKLDVTVAQIVAKIRASQ
ncbi:MAG: guanylate kinase [Phycisphaerales bacterium]|nr:guanylate kinase [Phycisphaerales bacterium]